MDSLTSGEPDHEAIIELLPDYAVGALDERSVAAVQRHLAACPSCRAVHTTNLEILGLLSNAPAPSPSVRSEFLTRALEDVPVPGSTDTRQALTPLPGQPEQDAPSAVRRPTPLRYSRHRAIPVAIAAAAAAILLVAILGAWRINQQDPAPSVIAEIVTTAPSYQLTESDLVPPASGILFARADENRAVLRAENLAPLQEGQQYQIWLFNTDGDRTAGGLFAPDPGGGAEVLIEAPQAMAAYAAVAVSAEPASGSEEPTSPLALGGWLAPQ